MDDDGSSSSSCMHVDRTGSDLPPAACICQPAPWCWLAGMDGGMGFIS